MRRNQSCLCSFLPMFLTNLLLISIVIGCVNASRNGVKSVALEGGATTAVDYESPISAPNEISIAGDYDNDRHFFPLNLSGKFDNDSSIDNNDDLSEGKEPCHSHLFFIIIYGPLFGIVCGVGILGNSLSFAVLHADPPTRPRKYNFRPKLGDQRSMDPSGSESRDVGEKRQCSSCSCCCCCCRKKRRAFEGSFQKRSNTSCVTSASLVSIPSTKTVSIKSIISNAILRQTAKQSSQDSAWRGKRRGQGQSVSSFLLKSLAITDNVYLATSALVQIYTAVGIYFGREKEFEKVFYYLQKYFWPVNYLAQLATVWMMVLVAANRYIAVCKPLHASRLCTKSKVRRQMIILGVSLVLYNLPRFFEFDYRLAKPANGTNSSDPQLKPVNYGLVTYPLYNILYENVAYCLVAFFLPLSILIFFNVRLMATLRSAEKFRPAQSVVASSPSVRNSSTNITSTSFVNPMKQGEPSSSKMLLNSSFPPTPTYRALSNPAITEVPASSPTSESPWRRGAANDKASEGTETKDSTLNDTVQTPATQAKSGSGKSQANADERNITMVMIIIILTFIVCETPAATNQILFYLVDTEARSTCSSYMKFYHISNLLIVLNSALNFFIYFLFRRKFQDQLWSLICRKRNDSNY